MKTAPAIFVLLPLASLPLAPSRLFAADSKAPTLADLQWLEGSWVQRGKGVENEEHWIAAKGGMMLGLNRTTREQGRTSFEFFRIEQTTNGISYFASPQGRAAPPSFASRSWRRTAWFSKIPNTIFPSASCTGGRGTASCTPGLKA